VVRVVAGALRFGVWCAMSAFGSVCLVRRHGPWEECLGHCSEGRHVDAARVHACCMTGSKCRGAPLLEHCSARIASSQVALVHY
jgi:hypothetical protein